MSVELSTENCQVLRLIRFIILLFVQILISFKVLAHFNTMLYNLFPFFINNVLVQLLVILLEITFM